MQQVYLVGTHLESRFQPVVLVEDHHGRVNELGEREVVHGRHYRKGNPNGDQDDRADAARDCGEGRLLFVSEGHRSGKDIIRMEFVLGPLCERPVGRSLLFGVLHDLFSIVEDTIVIGPELGVSLELPLIIAEVRRLV